MNALSHRIVSIHLVTPLSRTFAIPAICCGTIKIHSSSNQVVSIYTRTHVNSVISMARCASDSDRVSLRFLRRQRVAVDLFRLCWPVNSNERSSARQSKPLPMRGGLIQGCMRPRP
ncbi:hypothetical protein BJY52DRAFT_836067 [Lactarius psammicola]|nr:hypothetical protein BJY52DRAFT_836067 [Lactarius psammicola]